MRKIMLLGIALVFATAFCSAQKKVLYDECGTKDPTEKEFKQLTYYGNEAELNRMIDSYKNYVAQEKSGKSSAQFYRIPVYFWYYYNEDSPLSELTDFDFQQSVDEVNRVYSLNEMPVFFYIKCIRQEYRGNLQNIGMVDAVVQLLNKKDAGSINIHVLSNNLQSNFYSPISDAIYVRRNTLATADNRETFPHEVGHFFGLNHTHVFHNFSQLAEPVTREWIVNFTLFPPQLEIKHCSFTGDGLCDTPADPNMTLDVNLEDTDGDGDMDLFDRSAIPWPVTAPNRYIGNNVPVVIPSNGNSPVLDDYGEQYSPMEGNIMAYANRGFRNDLSMGQRAIIVNDIEKRDWDLWEASLNGFPEYFQGDNYEYDNTVLLSRFIAFNDEQKHNFHTNIYALQDLPPLGSCDDDIADWYLLDDQAVFGETRLTFEQPDGLPIPIDIGQIQIVESIPIGMGEFEFMDVSGNVTIASTLSTIEITLPCDLNQDDIRIGVFPDLSIGQHDRNYTAKYASVIAPMGILAGEQICLDDPISIENLPANATVEWIDQSFNGELELSTTSGATTSILNANGSANSTFVLQAVVVFDGCTQTLSNVFVQGISGLSYVGNISGAFIGWECEPQAQFSIATAGATNIDWSCTSTSLLFLGCTENGNKLTANFAFVSYDETIDVDVEAVVADDCGRIETRTFSLSELFRGCEDGPRSVQISPNPASNNIQVHITEKNNKQVVDEYYLFFTDPTGNTSFITQGTDTHYDINVGGFMNGVHYLHVVVGDHVTSEQFIIQH